MPTVRFTNTDVALEANEGESLFDVGLRNGLSIETACVGKGTCGLCRVRIVEGEDQLSPYNAVEEKHLGNVYHITKVRLSCQAVVHGDVVAEIVVKRRRKKK